MFQSLGRDSVHSSSSLCRRSFQNLVVSIPRSGFCSFKRWPYPNSERYPLVSIPRSGFCSFKLLVAVLALVNFSRFNPSVGILFIQAVGSQSRGCRPIKFQSLGRDSVHSSLSAAQPQREHQLVSIPRSGFCSFKPHRGRIRWHAGAGFNPSVGILFIQARQQCKWLRWVRLVSIPRSGFCSFKRRVVGFECGIM